MEPVVVNPDAHDLPTLFGITKIRAKELEESTLKALKGLAYSHLDSDKEYVSTADEVSVVMPLLHDEKEVAYIMFVIGVQEERMHQFQETMLNGLGEVGKQMRERLNKHKAEVRKKAQKPVNDILDEIFKKKDDTQGEDHVAE